MKMIKQKEFTIGRTKVGGSNPCFVTAEIGINYDGKFEQALKLIDVAAEAGCNAVKFQLFRAERMYTKGAGKYRVVTGEKKDIIEIIRKHELLLKWIPKLQNHTGAKNLEFYSTVCDEKSADSLEKYNPSAYKFASYAITHIPLFRHIAAKRKPIIFSCAGARLSEVDEVVRLLKVEGSNKVVLMHCMGKYPIPLRAANLNIIKTLQLAFPDIVVGYSDHSSDPVVAPTAAVALGAKMIEKHITLDRNLPGPDHSFALDPKELRLMVKAIRSTENKLKERKKIRIDPKVLGSSERKTYPIENYVRKFCYRGVFSIRRMKRAERFSNKNIAVLRPGEKKNGIHPRYYDLLTKGYRASRNIPYVKGITWDDVLQK